MTVLEYVGGAKTAMTDFYCRRCGAELEVHWADYDEYDTQTGKKRMTAVGRCPNRKGALGFLHEGFGLIAGVR